MRTRQNLRCHCHGDGRNCWEVLKYLWGLVAGSDKSICIFVSVAPEHPNKHPVLQPLLYLCSLCCNFSLHSQYLPFWMGRKCVQQVQGKQINRTLFTVIKVLWPPQYFYLRGRLINPKKSAKQSPYPCPRLKTRDIQRLFMISRWGCRGCRCKSRWSVWFLGMRWAKRKRWTTCKN